MVLLVVRIPAEENDLIKRLINFQQNNRVNTFNLYLRIKISVISRQYFLQFFTEKKIEIILTYLSGIIARTAEQEFKHIVDFRRKYRNFAEDFIFR